MNNTTLILLIRVAVGLAGGWALSYFFFTPQGGKVDWFIALVLAALVVSAAYLSEAWKKRKEDKK
jgi:uncharacterized membrane protein YfcA